MKNPINYTINPGTVAGAIEISFAEKPAPAVREALKALRFRWNGKKSVWYGFSDAETVRAALALGENPDAIPAEAPQKPRAAVPALDLWKATRRDDLPAYGTENDLKKQARDRANANGYGYDRACAEIIRAHLRERFPGFKFSVTSGGAGWLNNVEIVIKSGYAPRERGEGENYHATAGTMMDTALYAVYEYCEALHDAFDDDDGDHYADYGAYHDLYGSAKISYSYTQTEPTEAQREALEAFEASRAEWERAEEARQAAEWAERERLAEIERAEAEKRRAEWEITRAQIAEHITVEEIPEDAQTLTACEEGIGKESNLDKVRQLIEERREEGTDVSRLAKASRRITFTDPALLEAFAAHLMESWDFLAGMGGSHTDDPRVEDMDAWLKLSPEQRETVAWYACNCVAVYLGDALQFIIDPQGYDYARYALIPTGESAELPPQDPRGFYIPEPLDDQMLSICEGDYISVFRDSIVSLNMMNEYAGTVEKISRNDMGHYIITLSIPKKTPRERQKTVLETDFVRLKPSDAVQIYAGHLEIPQNIRYDINDHSNGATFIHQRDNKEMFPILKAYAAEVGAVLLVDTVPGFTNPAQLPA